MAADSHGKNYGLKDFNSVSLEMAACGREIMSFACGQYQRQQLRAKLGQADLLYSADRDCRCAVDHYVAKCSDK